MTEKTIFKKIIDGEIPTDLIYEDDFCLAFNDIDPKAPTHVLVISREEIVSVADITSQHQALLGHIWSIIPKLATQLQLDNGYRVVVNCGQDGGQSVDHLHFHLLGGRPLNWPPG